MPEQSLSAGGGPVLQQPPIERGNWLLGYLPQIRRNPLEALNGLWQKHGDLVRFRVAAYVGYLATHPDYVKHVLVDNHPNYSKENIDYQMLKPIVGEGLLTSNGDFWLRQRRLIQPAFHRQRIYAFGAIMSEAAEELLAQWEAPIRNQQPVDIANEMMRLTLAIAGKTLFSQDISATAGAVGPAFATASESVSMRFRSLVPIPFSWPTPGNRRFFAAMAKLDQVVADIITRRKSALAQGDPAPDDLLTMLVQARDEQSGQGMTDKQLRDEVMTLLLAGHETTANATAWTWYLLSQHPEIWTRLQEELRRVLNGRTPTIEDLPALEYTHWILQESMRLYPPAWIISRQAIEDDRLGDFHVPAGSAISMSSYLTHRHPEFWQKPAIFDPERFSPAQAAGRPTYAYYPFGGGPRLCIGRDFALVEARLILATIAQKVYPQLVPGHPVELEPLITLRPKHGLRMLLSSLS